MAGTILNAKFRKVFKDDISLGEGTEFVTGNDGSIIEVEKFNASLLPIIEQAYDFIVSETDREIYENNVNDVLTYVNNKINDINLADYDDDVLLSETTKNNISYLPENATQQDYNIIHSNIIKDLLNNNNTSDNGLYYYNVDLTSGNAIYNIYQENLRLNSEIVFVGSGYNSSFTTRVNIMLKSNENISQKITFSSSGMGGWDSSTLPKIYFYVDGVETALQLSHKPENQDKVLYYSIDTFTVGAIVFFHSIEIKHLDNNKFTISIKH